MITNPSGHLGPEDFYDLVELRLSRTRHRELETHLERCADCTETLAVIVRSERPASREEQELLARAPEPTPEHVLERLKPALVASSVAARRRAAADWRTLLAAAAALVALATGGWFVYTKSWLPAESRRIAAETLASIVEIRQATGRIPLRYITELERASITRSGFDLAGPDEEVLLANLREAVHRSPEPEALLVLGLLLLDDGEIEEAETLFQKVGEATPSSVDALNGLAVVHYERALREPGNSYRLLQRGLAYLRQAQAASPEDLRVLYNFGKFYEALEMRDAALQAWSRYIAKDPASQWAEEAAFHLAQQR